MTTGDLVNIRHDELDDMVIKSLSRVSSRDGVYSVLGNHDLGFYIADTVKLPVELHLELLLEKHAQIGWQMLNDTTIYIKR